MTKVNIDTELWIKIIEIIVKEIKKKFPNQTAEETIKLAHEIGRQIFAEIENRKVND